MKALQMLTPSPSSSRSQRITARDLPSAVDNAPHASLYLTLSLLTWDTSYLFMTPHALTILCTERTPSW